MKTTPTSQAVSCQGKEARREDNTNISGSAVRVKRQGVKTTPTSQVVSCQGKEASHEYNTNISGCQLSG